MSADARLLYYTAPISTTPHAGITLPHLATTSSFPLPLLRATLGTATPSRSLVYLPLFFTAGCPPLSFSLFNARVVALAYRRRSRGRGRATTRLQSSSLFSRPVTGRYPCCRVFYDIASHIQIF